MALYFKCSKRPSNLVAAVVGCFLRPGQRVLVTATLSRVSVWTSEGQKFSNVLYIEFYIENVLWYSLSSICVRTDFDTAPLHLLGGDHTPTFAAAIAFCCIPNCGREGAAGGHTDLLLVLMKVCMNNNNKGLFYRNIGLF